MGNALFASVSALRTAGLRVQQSAHNLANANTNGFVPGRIDQADLPGGGVRAIQGNSGPAGPITPTGNPLDLAIDGRGYFALADGKGGQVYSRTGSFSLDAQGRLVDQSGRQLVPGIRLPADAQHLAVSADGQVEALDGQGQVLAQFQLETAAFANPAGLQPLGDNALAATAASGPPVMAAPGQVGHGALVPGALQRSGTDLATEMVNMIVDQRVFEANVKAVQTEDEMLGTVLDIKG